MNYLITGKQGSGKTTKALRMSKKYIIIEGSDANIKKLRDTASFLFNNANIDTTHIIIETNADVLEKYETTFRCLLKYEKILINKKGKEPFYISPTFIIISQTFVDISDKRDLEHIHCA